jgi:PAS domain S-box-containing protein
MMGVPRILLVEDDQDQALLISRALNRGEPTYAVTVVSNGDDCLTALAQERYALVLLDFRLPRENGLQVLRAMHQAGHQTPVIMMTAHGDEAIAVEVMKAGAADYIVKQRDYLSELRPVVAQTLQRHRLERELAQSQQRYRLLFEASRDAILILDSQDRMVDLNPRAELLLGGGRDQAVGTHLLQWIQPEQPEQIAAWLEELRDEHIVSPTVTSFVNREGVRRWVEISADWLGDPEQQGVYQLILHDVARDRRDQEVWNALNRASLAAHNQLDPEAIYRAVGQVLLELGLSSSMWWLDDRRRALQMRYSTYQQEVLDQFEEKTGFDVRNLWFPAERLTIFRDRVMQGETVYLEDGVELVRQMVGSDDPGLIEWTVEYFNAKAAILLPFFIADVLAGMLLIHGELSAQSVPPARAFARQISSALEHARLYNDAQRRVRELAALQEISFKLSTTLELQPLMEAITRVTLQLTDADNCHIYLVAKGAFQFVAALHRDGSTLPAVSQPRPDGLVARVARMGEALFINDAKRHMLYQSPEAQEWGIQAIAGCPLLRGGQVLGVFTLTYLARHRFDRAETHILTLLADQAAAAVETAQLYQDAKRRNADLSHLYQVALAVSAQDHISDVLDEAYQAVTRTTGAHTFAVGLFDKSGDELVYKLIREEGELAFHPNLPLDDCRSLTAWVARNRKALIINDMQQEDLPVPGVTVGDPIRSWIGFPLVAGERLVGVMSVQSFEPNAFDAAHRRLCRSIATQLAIALEKARLLEEVRHQNWELSLLNKVSSAVGQSLEFEALLEGALSIVLEEMNLDAGAFHLIETDSDELKLVCQKNIPSREVEQIRTIEPGQGLCGQVVLAGRAIVANHHDAEMRRLSDVLTRFQTMASIPLTSKDLVVGTLLLLGLEPRQFSDEEISLLDAVGHQIGVTIENAVLYRRTMDRERRLARLNEASRSLSSVLEARTLFQRVLETAVGELPVSAAFLWLPEDGEGLSSQLSSGPLAHQAGARGVDVRDEMIRVLREKDGVLWTNRANPERWIGVEITGKRGYRAAVPLRGQSSDVGVLEVLAAEGEDCLASNDVEFLSTLGGIAAIAHENAQLYDAITQYAVSLEAKIEERTAQVRREKEQTEAILRSVADSIFVLGDRSDVLLTNTAGEMLLNISPDHSGQLRDFLNRVAEQPDSDAPGPTITLNGQTLQARAAKIRQEEEELGTVIVLRDVTHFEEVNRLKSEFVSTVSHELRTPLSNLKLYLSLLERGRAEKRQDYQKVLVQEVNRLENLIQDLLDLSKLGTESEVSRREPVDLAEIVAHILAVLNPQAEARQIQLSQGTSVAGKRHWVEADREQMVQMLINLVANAINYTKPGGRVSINLSNEADRRGAWIIARIEDTGVGIAPNEMARIFDRFFRGKVQQHMCAGTGLGLAIVKEILEQHGGWITVESEIGVGSLFTVGLPAANPSGSGDEDAKR